jgi:hypothetical protein
MYYLKITKTDIELPIKRLAIITKSDLTTQTSLFSHYNHPSNKKRVTKGANYPTLHTS